MQIRFFGPAGLLLLFFAGLISLSPGFVPVRDGVASARPAKSEWDTIKAKEFRFIPDTLWVTEGTLVSIRFRDVGQLAHNLTIAHYATDTESIPGGTGDTLQFRADTVGTFPFWCDVPGHRQAGMEGVLIVRK